MSALEDRCFWDDPTYVPSAPLSEHTHADVLIVGGGITGLMSAHFLLERGVTNIVILEKDTVGSGSTGRSAGMLVSEPETASWPALVKAYGVPLMKKFRAAERDAMEEIIHIAETGDIECDMRESEVLFVAGNTLAERHVLSDFSARQLLDAPALLLKGKQLFEELTSGHFTLGERLDNAVSVHPLKLIHGIARSLRERGVRIYEGTPLLGVTDTNARTPHGTISFGKIIYALGTHEKNTNLKNFATTIAVTNPLSEEELASMGLADRDIFIDDEEESFHYGKITGDGRLLIGYGDLAFEGEEAVLPLHTPHVDNIRAFLTRLFPNVTLQLHSAWSGVYSLSSALLPFVAVTGNTARLGGAGLWIDSVVSAQYGVAKLLNDTHPLDELFAKKSVLLDTSGTERKVPW